jgi:hypothetical protein
LFSSCIVECCGEYGCFDHINKGDLAVILFKLAPQQAQQQVESNATAVASSKANAQQGQGRQEATPKAQQFVLGPPNDCVRFNPSQPEGMLTVSETVKRIQTIISQKRCSCTSTKLCF